MTTQQPDDQPEDTTMDALAPPPPPPGQVDAQGRRGLNSRVRESLDDALREYQARHRTTRQAVLEQAIREYLDRRGLLPEDER